MVDVIHDFVAVICRFFVCLVYKILEEAIRSKVLVKFKNLLFLPLISRLLQYADHILNS